MLSYCSFPDGTSALSVLHTSFSCTCSRSSLVLIFFCFNDTATTEIYTLSLHDALPIYSPNKFEGREIERLEWHQSQIPSPRPDRKKHTSELQSPDHLVCRLLLEKKKLKRSLIFVHGMSGLVDIARRRVTQILLSYRASY